MTRIRKSLRTGNTAYNKGGGLYRCWGQISDCEIIGNCAVGLAGGGLSLCGTTSNCIISGNSAGKYGGGISSPLGPVRNCTITGNISSYGGAICDEQSSPLISNCTISGNTAICDGGGIYCWIDSHPTINNCILWEDTANRGSEIAVGLFNDPWGGTIPSSITIKYSDVEGGAESVHVDPECTLNWGTGNIDTDPLCLQQGYWDYDCTPEEPRDFWVGGDYHLRFYSSCINAGDPGGDYTGQTDIDGDQRVRYGLIDIGANEVYPIAGDFSPPDEVVDINDLGIFFNNWLNACSEAGWSNH